MDKLITPFGEAMLLLDGKETDYRFHAVPRDPRTCPDLFGRYALTVDFPPDGKPHTLICTLPALGEHPCVSEPGEGLMLVTAEIRNIRLSIGIRADNCGFPRRDYEGFDTAHGIGFRLFPHTKTRRFVFRIAWIVLGSPHDGRALQTWFGADPSQNPAEEVTPE